jgi:hypothetical protein
MDRKVIRRPLTADSRTQFQATYVRFVLEKVALGQVSVCLPVHQSSPISIIPPMLHTDLFLYQSSPVSIIPPMLHTDLFLYQSSPISIIPPMLHTDQFLYQSSPISIFPPMLHTDLFLDQRRYTYNVRNSQGR